MNEFAKAKRGQRVRPFKFLDFKEGTGRVVPGETQDEQDQRIDGQFASPQMIAVNTLGQLVKHPRVNALSHFISGWYLSYLTAVNTRVTPEAGPRERLSATGDNLPNVIQYLKEQHGDRLEEILGSVGNPGGRVFSG